LKRAKENNVKVHLPVDTLVADAFSENAQTAIFPIGEIPEGWMGLDIGPKTRDYFAKIVADSKTILWNGPVGVFEMPTFAEGTKSLGKAIASATESGAFSLVGGGDSVAAVKQFNLTGQMSYVSTGGGAMLESLEGKVLPGVAAVLD
jgi:phosphoglycerate kinase